MLACVFFFAQLKKAFPKRPRSAYILFCKAKRERYHKRHPELSPTEATVKLGKKWKEMEEEHKVRESLTHFLHSTVC